MARTLYICYFGMREPLVQTQVLPYLREIRKGTLTAEPQSRGEEKVEISLLTFEPRRAEADRAEFETIRAELAAEGIEWHWLPYHKRFSALATAWDIFRGALFIWRRIGRFDVLHGRVHVPTLMGALARKFSFKKPKLLFDIRGFFPEEYTDAGIWPEGGLLFRSAKRVERWLLKESDAFVVLTEKAREILYPESKATGRDKLGRPVEVIPCCVDMSRFASATPEMRAKMRSELGVSDRFVLAYVGAFGGWYMTEETADLFGVLKVESPDSFAMILTQSKPEVIEPLLRARGYSPSDYFIKRVPAAEIPNYLSAADAAVSFIKPCFSKQASSPTKNAEYLACGLPIIANAGVGDVDELIEGHNVGYLIRDLSFEEYSKAVRHVQSVGDRTSDLRSTAKEEFDLYYVGGKRYRRIYSRMGVK